MCAISLEPTVTGCQSTITSRQGKPATHRRGHDFGVLTLRPTVATTGHGWREGRRLRRWTIGLRVTRRHGGAVAKTFDVTSRSCAAESDPDAGDQVHVAGDADGMTFISARTSSARNGNRLRGRRSETTARIQVRTTVMTFPESASGVKETRWWDARSSRREHFFVVCLRVYLTGLAARRAQPTTRRSSCQDAPTAAS